MFDELFWERVAKLTVIALASPLWWPIAKAMWHEFSLALIPEGGLFGKPPTVQEIEKALAERDDFDPLVSEPWAHTLQSRGSQSRGGSTRGQRTGIQRSGGRRQPVRRR